MTVLVLCGDMSEQQPVAWAFYHPDGTLRFIIDDRARMEAWKSAHEGTIVPLVAQGEKQA